MQAIVTYLKENNKEFVFIYEDWHKNQDAFNYVINLAQLMPNELHMAFVHVDVNSYGNGDLMPSILMAMNFESVSLIDTAFKRFFSRWVGAKRKTISQRIAESKWCDISAVTYKDLHDTECICQLTDLDINTIAQQLGVKPAVVHHDLIILNNKYLRLKKSNVEKTQLLDTREAKLILTELKLI